MAEELTHVEMISSLIYALTKDATPKELDEAGLGCNYAKYGKGIFLSDCSGEPFTTAYIGLTGDYKADLTENLAAEEKARLNYEHLLDLSNDEDVNQVLLYLRQREVVHYNRFKELLEVYNKEFDK